MAREVPNLPYPWPRTLLPTSLQSCSFRRWRYSARSGTRCFSHWPAKWITRWALLSTTSWG